MPFGTVHIRAKMGAKESPLSSISLLVLVPDGSGQA
jgi:hypothetical protein